MGFQITMLCKQFITKLTFEFFSGVKFHVSFQIRIKSKRFATKITFEILFSTVNFCVIFQNPLSLLWRKRDSCQLQPKLQPSATLHYQIRVQY